MKKVIFLGFFLIGLISPSYAFWGNTHQRISGVTFLERKEIIAVGLKNIGLDYGHQETFNGNNIRDIIENGAISEDNGTRALNHFYNPIDGSGLKIYDLASNYSSFDWANQIHNGWSWTQARENFYLGLVAASDAERRSAIADSFRALGQVMHLLQDKAVPAHVRNDAHPPPSGDGFEAYTSKNVDALNFTPIPFSGQKYSLRYCAPRQLWDSDSYDGTNPSTNTSIGLAEYTNANFASQDTIFSENNLTDWDPLNDNHYFPFPRRADTVVFTESQNTTWNGFEVYRKYFEKVGGGEPIKHFATASRLYAYLLDDPDPSLQGLDDRCHKDYADLLIPRAVGYSAALIDYFFRGKISMDADPNNPSQYVIKNESDEDMSGTFRLYYDDKSDVRKLIKEWQMDIIAKNSSSPIILQEPDDAKEAGKYVLVFYGNLGQETDAFVGMQIELIKQVYGRMVINYERNSPYITVFTEKGTMNTVMPGNNFHLFKTIRFVINDPDRFVAVAYYYYPNVGSFYEGHLFNIDVKNRKINYVGKIWDHIIREGEHNSNKLCHGSVWDDGNGETCSRPFWSLERFYNYSFNIYDLIFEDDTFSALVSERTAEENVLYPCNERVRYNNGTCTDEIVDNRYGCGTKTNISGYDEYKITYRSNSEYLYSSWNDGSYDLSTGCDDFANSNANVQKIENLKIPLLALNKNDYVFVDRKVDEFGNIHHVLKTTNGVEIPIAGDYMFPKIVSSLRKEGKYSLFIIDKYDKGIPEISFSSETGKMECSGFLISENNIGWRITPGAIQIVKFENCQNWETLYTMPTSLNNYFENAIYDFAIIQ